MFKNTFLKSLILFLFSAVFTLTTAVMGSPFIRAFRRVSGARVYWGILLLAVLGIAIWPSNFPAIFLLIAVWIAVGIFSEFERTGIHWLINTCIAIFSSVVTVAALGFNYLRTIGITKDFYSFFTSKVESFLGQLKAIDSSLSIDASVIVNQGPSAFVGLLIISLALSIIFETKILQIFLIEKEQIANRINLLGFRMPNFFIWIAMVTFLFTFVDTNIVWLKPVAVNLFNLSVVFYFFQGLAITVVLFQVLKVGAFLKSVLYFLIITQLFLAVSAVGFADFWIDIRRRLKSFKTAENN